MSKLLSALFVAAAAFAIAPTSFAGGWCSKNNNNNNGHHCKGGNHHNCGHNGGGGGWGGGWGNGCNNGGNSLDCDAGGPYTVGAQAPFVVIELDGTDSRNETEYAWSTSYPGAIFDDPNSGRPTLTVPVDGTCSFQFTVRLTVSNSKSSKTCTTTVRVRDQEPPVIVVPQNSKIFCGASESPNALGRAEATDNCDSKVSICYSDKITYTDCPADRFDHIIERRWKATDNDCNTSKGTQIIDVVKEFTFLDVRPGVCPNDYNPDTCELLPIAILGLEGFNVGNIQWNTVKLYGRGCEGGPVSAQCFQLKDVAGPTFGGPECSCAVVPPDGNLDLVAFFSRNKLNQRLGLDDMKAGTSVSVVITGRLANGCKFVAEDCMVVL